MVCWMTRHEAAGFEYSHDYCPDDWTCEPPHDHGPEASYDRLECWYDWATAMCTLDADHEGDHDFTAQKNVILSFAPGVQG